MRSAAGDHLKIAHGHNAHMLRYRRRLAQRKAFQFLLIREPAADGRVHADALVDSVFQQGNLFIRQMSPPLRHGNVNGGFRLPQMQADGGAAKLFPNCAGQHMFSAVLLHVVCPARAVDLAAHRGAGSYFPVDRVHNIPVRCDFHIRDLRFILAEGKRSRVIWLPAGSRVKSAPVQGNLPLSRPFSVLDRRHGSVELPQI